MRSFFLGFLTAALLAGGGYYFYLQKPPIDACRMCGIGTRCENAICVAATAAPPVVVAKRRPGRRPSATSPSPATPSVGTSPGTEAPSVQPPIPDEPPPPPPPTLTAEEKRLSSVGDKITGTEVLTFEEGKQGSDRELTQGDIDAVFQPRQPQILGCIDDARGEALIASRVSISFRIRRTGVVSGVRVEAPNYLLSHGLYNCIRNIVMPLHFPAGNQSQIVTYPFALN